MPDPQEASSNHKSVDAQTQLDTAMARARAQRDEVDRERRARRERQRVVNLRPLEATHSFRDRLQEAQALGDYLADSSVRLVVVVGRGGMGKTALVCRVLAGMEEAIRTAPATEGPPPGPWAHYEAGLERLLEQLPPGHPCYAEVLVYEQRLRENIAEARRYSDIDSHRANRAETVDRLNGLCLKALGISFNDLCWAEAPSSPEPSPGHLDGILYLSARSTGLGLERIYADSGLLLGEQAALRLANRWAEADTPLVAKVEYLLENLQEGLYLILLDNLEDTLSADGAIADEGLRLFVERCLAQPCGARLLVTSRERVRLDAAALPGMRQLALKEGLPEEEAVALLRDLDPQGNLGLRSASAENLHRAARLTQGIPRALEIVAGILQEDPAASLGSLLADERLFGEQVVERLVEEGYRRLGRNERRIMEALAVYNRPVKGIQLNFLLHPWFPELDVPAGLRRLVGSYFVSASRGSHEFSLHPLDREHAYQQLPAGEGSGYNRRNLELRAAEFYAEFRKKQDEWLSIDDVSTQLAEFEHRLRAADYDEACRVLDSIDYDYLSLWGHDAPVLEMRQRLLGRLTDPGLAATNVGRLGAAISTVEGTASQRAIDCFDQALAIAREIGNRRSEGEWLGHLGTAYRGLGEVHRAITYYQDALGCARSVGDRRNETIWLNRLGLTYTYLGEFARAIGLYEEGLAIAREIGDRRREGLHLGYMGFTYGEMGDAERAIELCTEALAIAREIGYRRSEVNWLGRLADVYSRTGATEEAALLYHDAQQIAVQIHYRQGESWQLVGLGRLHCAKGRTKEAQAYCEQVREYNVPESDHLAALVLGMILLRQGDPTAGAAFAEAVASCQAMLSKTPALYSARYALTAALVGQAVCSPPWAEAKARAELLTPALAEYRRALQNCAGLGVIQDARRDLGLIRAAGVEGLEPAYALLEEAVPQHGEHLSTGNSEPL